MAAVDLKEKTVYSNAPYGSVKNKWQASIYKDEWDWASKWNRHLPICAIDAFMQFSLYE